MISSSSFIEKDALRNIKRYLLELFGPPRFMVVGWTATPSVRPCGSYQLPLTAFFFINVFLSLKEKGCQRPRMNQHQAGSMLRRTGLCMLGTLRCISGTHQEVFLLLWLWQKNGRSHIGPLFRRCCCNTWLPWYNCSSECTCRNRSSSEDSAPGRILKLRSESSMKQASMQERTALSSRHLPCVS